MKRKRKAGPARKAKKRRVAIEEVVRFRPRQHREPPKRYFLPKIIKTPSTVRVPVPVQQQDWYEIRLYLPKERMPVSQYFKAGCHTESLNIAKKMARERRALHFELGKSSLKDVVPEGVNV